MNDENNQNPNSSDLAAKITILSSSWGKMIETLKKDVEEDRANGWIIAVKAGEEAVRLMEGMRRQLDEILLKENK